MLVSYNEYVKTYPLSLGVNYYEILFKSYYVTAVCSASGLLIINHQDQPCTLCCSYLSKLLLPVCPGWLHFSKGRPDV